MNKYLGGQTKLEYAPEGTNNELMALRFLTIKVREYVDSFKRGKTHTRSLAYQLMKSQLEECEKFKSK